MQPQFFTKTKMRVQRLLKTPNTFKIMQFSDLTMEQLAQLRKDITLNSLFVSDYENSLDMPCKLVYDFFMGYMDFLYELEMEKYGKDSDLPWEKFYKEFDTQHNLEEWYYMHEDFGDEDLWVDWCKLDEDEQYYIGGFAEFYNSEVN